MNRRTGNFGAFAELPERMSKKNIRKLAKAYNIDLKGITLCIETDEHNLQIPITGEAAPIGGGRIAFLPNAFRSRETLLRTLIHERTHIEQFKQFGVAYVQEHISEFEALAYAEGDAFIERLRKAGVKIE